MRQVIRLIHSLLKELGDEAAYRRHLAATGVPHSPSEWRSFHETKLRSKYSRPKCC
jgi:hypothetical protein